MCSIKGTIWLKACLEDVSDVFRSFLAVEKSYFIWFSMTKIIGPSRKNQESINTISFRVISASIFWNNFQSLVDWRLYSFSLNTGIIDLLHQLSLLIGIRQMMRAFGFPQLVKEKVNKFRLLFIEIFKALVLLDPCFRVWINPNTRLWFDPIYWYKLWEFRIFF